MKKILLLILTLFLFLACYIIYHVTENNTIDYVLIGDELVNNPYIIKNSSYKNDFVNRDYRTVDLLRIIKYNEEILIDEKMVSIHQQLKEADVLVVSIGMKEISYKLNEETKDKYAYVNKLIYNLKELFSLIKQYDYQQIYFMGYYNNRNDNIELFNYLNASIKKMAKERQICVIEMEKMINNEDDFQEINGNFTLSEKSYKKIYNFIVENLEKC